jgi:hypothetical protein
MLRMNIPWTLLRTVIVSILVLWAYLATMEAALPASRKANKLPIYVACIAIDYQQGACL